MKGFSEALKGHPSSACTIITTIDRDCRILCLSSSPKNEGSESFKAQHSKGIELLGLRVYTLAPKPAKNPKP